MTSNPSTTSSRGTTTTTTTSSGGGLCGACKFLRATPPCSDTQAARCCRQAQARRRDPIYDCVVHIFALHQQDFCSLTSTTSATSSTTSATSSTSTTSSRSTANVRGSNATDGSMLQTSTTGFQNF